MSNQSSNLSIYIRLTSISLIQGSDGFDKLQYSVSMYHGHGDLVCPSSISHGRFLLSAPTSSWPGLGRHFDKKNKKNNNIVQSSQYLYVPPIRPAEIIGFQTVTSLFFNILLSNLAWIYMHVINLKTELNCHSIKFNTCVIYFIIFSSNHDTE